MINHKTFLFRNPLGRLCIIVFVWDPSTGKLMVTPYGNGSYRVFPNKDFTNCHTVNSTTNWLLRNGYTYIKRLPVLAGTKFDENEVYEYYSVAKRIIPTYVAKN